VHCRDLSLVLINCNNLVLSLLPGAVLSGFCIVCVEWSKTTVCVRCRCRHRNQSTSRRRRPLGVDPVDSRGSSRHQQGSVSPSVFLTSPQVILSPATARLIDVAQVESTASWSIRHRRRTSPSARRPRQVPGLETHCRERLSLASMKGELQLSHHQTLLNSSLSEKSNSPITFWFALKVGNFQSI